MVPVGGACTKENPWTAARVIQEGRAKIHMKRKIDHKEILSIYHTFFIDIPDTEKRNTEICKRFSRTLPLDEVGRSARGKLRTLGLALIVIVLVAKPSTPLTLLVCTGSAKGGSASIDIFEHTCRLPRLSSKGRPYGWPEKRIVNGPGKESLPFLLRKRNILNGEKLRLYIKKLFHAMQVI